MDKRETLVRPVKTNPWDAIKVLGFLLTAGAAVFTAEYYFVLLLLRGLDLLLALLA